LDDSRVKEICLCNKGYSWGGLSENPHDAAIDMFLLKGYLPSPANENSRAVKLYIANRDSNNRFWGAISANSNDIAVDYLLAEVFHTNTKIDYYELSQNKNTRIYPLIVKNLKNINGYDYIEDDYLYELEAKYGDDSWSYEAWACCAQTPNSNMVDYLIKNPDKIYWKWFSGNCHDDAVSLLLKPENKDKINWEYFSENSHDLVVDLLLKPENNDKISLRHLVKNKNPRIRDLLFNMLDAVKYDDNADIDTWDLCANPIIFILDADYINAVAELLVKL
jgi:hypothetical protein